MTALASLLSGAPEALRDKQISAFGFHFTESAKCSAQGPQSVLDTYAQQILQTITVAEA